MHLSTIADLLTYRGSSFLMKGKFGEQKELMDEIQNACTMYFDGSYRRAHQKSSGGIIFYDEKGDMIRKEP